MKSITRGLHRDQDTMYHHSRFCLVIVDYTPTRRSLDSDYCVICKCLLLKIFEVLSTQAWNTAWLGSKIFSIFVQLFIVYTPVKIFIYFACVFSQVGVSEIKGRCSYHFNVVVIICDTFLSFWCENLTGISFIHKCVCFDYNSVQIIPDFEQWGFILCKFLWTKYELRFIVYSTHIQHHVCACCGAKYPTFVNLHSTKLFSFFPFSL